jgi:mono/diheme cytochrome c family protein
MWPLLLLFAFGVIGMPRSAAAEDIKDISKAMYLKYCSACHGEAGAGDGVVSGFMRPKPTDLTTMAKDAGGEFPFMKAMQSIDGTVTIRAHGESQMPVWGEKFKDETTLTMQRRAEIKGKLLLITEYVRSLQK